MRALITGSGGLVGSACVRFLCERGWRVTGVDNDTRAWFFGPDGSTHNTIIKLLNQSAGYEHEFADIRDRAAMRILMKELKPDLIIHAAAQPAHDKARDIPYEDFEVNAVGTLNMLVAARDYAKDSPFIYCSTSKVYGDRPNQLPLVEHEKRYDYAHGINGIAEALSIDQCLHSLFGASKVAADILCQEYGRYFNMPVGIFRGACLTGPDHAAVPLHGYLAYIVHCAARGTPYTVIGYKGKQVRDQIHCDDVASLFWEFYQNPKAGEVYNMGSGRPGSLSILETIDYLEEFGLKLDWTYEPTPRIGDHICYISDLTKTKRDFPKWEITRDLRSIIGEMVERYRP